MAQAIQTQHDESAPVFSRIEKRLNFLYGDELGPLVSKRIRRFVETHKQLRTRSVVGPYWTQRDIVLITYGDSIQSATRAPLQTLRAFLYRHLPVEFSMVHILPFFPWSSDDGFSITDFRAVNPELGTWEDIAALEECYDLVIDLVLNHCSRENLWFADYLSGDAPACNYFIEVDAGENLTMVTRPRSSPLLTRVRTHRGMRQVWATFSNDQIDLNYRNPDVLLEFIDILLYYFRRGARMVRLDAVAYLWKHIGTRCIHLPQTHEIIKLFRDVLSLVEPGALIMTETNVPHDENITYFGNGDEANVIYQFSLPPLLMHAVHCGDTRYLTHWAKSIDHASVPDGCTFLNFTASHDGVGLRPLEGLVPAEEVKSMLTSMRERGGYISTRANSDGTESPYELNISYFDAFRDPATGYDRWHISAFMLTQIVALTLKGIPAVYIHSLFATPNDHLGVERSGMTRAINRRKWDRSELESLMTDRTSETGRVFRLYKHLLNIRRRQPAFHPDAPQRILELDDALFGVERIAVDQGQRIVALFNFTSTVRQFPLRDLPADISGWKELIGITEVHHEDGRILLPPYGTYWFSRYQT
jgi:sucrose phosphorylase